jgi:peroxiredoxin
VLRSLSPSPAPADEPSGPHLGRAQELVYRGSFTEEALGTGVQFTRTYRLEERVFVLDATPKSADVAFLTLWKQRPATGEKPAESRDEPGNVVRLEMARLDALGRLDADPAVPLVTPLEGLPPLECGCFVEVPKKPLTTGVAWDVAELGRPLRSWEVAGTEMVTGTSCLKLKGTQQSNDWDHPRGDSTAWLREDTVWLAPRLGVAYRVERVIKRRDPARQNPTYVSTTRYELESSLTYPRQLYDDRKLEIQQTRAFLDAGTPLFAQPGKHTEELDALLTKIDRHLERQTPTPYRDALLQVRRRVEAARRGESPPAQAPAPSAPPAVAALGSPAPDFVAPDFAKGDLVRLQRWLGRPVVLVFYNPTSITAEDMLTTAQRISDTGKDEVAVVGLAMTEDGERVRKQREALGLTFPLVNGTGLWHSYAVERTPKVMVLDSTGVVRGAYDGWGPETAGAAVAELKRWLPHKDGKPK